jgi:hypothetical protein
LLLILAENGWSAAVLAQAAAALPSWTLQWRVRETGEEVGADLALLRNVDLVETWPIRKFPAHRRQRHISGVYAFAKTGRQLLVESREEFWCAMRLDYAATVIAASVQPCRIIARELGRRRCTFRISSRRGGIGRRC